MRYLLSTLVILAVTSLMLLHGGAYYDIFRVPAYLLLAIALFAAIPTAARTRTDFSIPCGLSAVCLFIYVLIRCMERGNPAWQVFGLATAAFGIYVLFAAAINQPHYRLMFILTLLALCVLETGIGVVQFSNSSPFILVPWFSEDLRTGLGSKYLIRAHGTYLNPNHYAAMLAAIAMYALSLVFWGKLKVWLKLLIFYVLLVCLAGILLSLSRGAFFATALSLLVFLGVSTFLVINADKAKKSLTVSLLILITCLVLGLGLLLNVTTFQVRNRLEHMLDSEARPELWQSALRQFDAAPFIGTGPATYKYISRVTINRWRTTLGGDPVYAHNDYFQFLAEYGLIGFALIILVFAFHLRNGFMGILRHVRNSDILQDSPKSNTLAILIGSLCSAVVWMVHLYFDSMQHLAANVLLASSSLGMLAGNGYHFRKRQESYSGQPGFFRQFPHRAAAVMAMVCGMALVYFCLRSTSSEYHALLAENALVEKNGPTALEQAKKAVNSQPSNARYLYLYGEALLMEGDDTIEPLSVRISNYKAGQQALQKAVDLFPEEYYYWLRLGRAYDATRNFAAAGPCYSRAISLNPSLGSVYEEYATHLGFEKRYEEAQAYAFIGGQQPGQFYQGKLRPQFIEKLKEQKQKQ